MIDIEEGCKHEQTEFMDVYLDPDIGGMAEYHMCIHCGCIVRKKK